MEEHLPKDPAGGEPDLPALAERLIELREEKRYLEGQIETVSGQLAAALGQGVSAEIGDVSLRITVAKPSLRIVKEGDVPTDFLTLKPDRARLLDHLAATGEVPPGVQVTEGRATVYAKRSKGDTR